MIIYQIQNIVETVSTKSGKLYKSKDVKMVLGVRISNSLRS